MEMNQEWIDQFNKKSLNFLGKKLEEMEFSYVEEYTNIECYRDMRIQDLQFHTDWNWIMQLLTHIKNEHYWFFEIKDDKSIIYDNLGKKFQQYSTDNKYNTIYVINQFIDYINKGNNESK